MVIKSLSDYMTDELTNRVSILQDALNQAERIIMVLEDENQRLKDVLSSLASDNEGYMFDSESFNEPACSIR